MRWGIPSGFLDPRPRFFRQDAAHGLAQKVFGYAVANLQCSFDPKHELHEPMIEKRQNVIESESHGLTVFRAQATRRGFTKHVLVSAVLEIAVKRILHHRLKAIEIEVVRI